MDAAPLSTLIEAPPNPRYVAVVGDAPPRYPLLAVHTLAALSSTETGVRRPIFRRPTLPFACNHRDRVKTLRDRTPARGAADGVDVRPAHRAYLACPQPWTLAIAVAVALLHCGLAQSQDALASRRRDQACARAPTPRIRHERATTRPGTLTVLRVQQQCA